MGRDYNQAYYLLEQSLKNSSWAQQNRFDGAASPLATDSGEDAPSVAPRKTLHRTPRLPPSPSSSSQISSEAGRAPPPAARQHDASTPLNSSTLPTPETSPESMWNPAAKPLPGSSIPYAPSPGAESFRTAHEQQSSETLRLSERTPTTGGVATHVSPTASTSAHSHSHSLKTLGSPVEASFPSPTHTHLPRRSLAPYYVQSEQPALADDDRDEITQVRRKRPLRHKQKQVGNLSQPFTPTALKTHDLQVASPGEEAADAKRRVVSSPIEQIRSDMSPLPSPDARRRTFSSGSENRRTSLTSNASSAVSAVLVDPQSPKRKHTLRHYGKHARLRSTSDVLEEEGPMNGQHPAQQQMSVPSTPQRPFLQQHSPRTPNVASMGTEGASFSERQALAQLSPTISHETQIPYTPRLDQVDQATVVHPQSSWKQDSATGASSKDQSNALNSWIDAETRSTLEPSNFDREGVRSGVISEYLELTGLPDRPGTMAHLPHSPQLEVEKPLPSLPAQITAAEPAQDTAFDEEPLNDRELSKSMSDDGAVDHMVSYEASFEELKHPNMTLRNHEPVTSATRETMAAPDAHVGQMPGDGTSAGHRGALPDFASGPVPKPMPGDECLTNRDAARDHDQFKQYSEVNPANGNSVSTKSDQDPSTTLPVPQPMPGDGLMSGTYDRDMQNSMTSSQGGSKIDEEFRTLESFYIPGSVAQQQARAASQIEPDRSKVRDTPPRSSIITRKPVPGATKPSQDANSRKSITPAFENGMAAVAEESAETESEEQAHASLANNDKPVAKEGGSDPITPMESRIQRGVHYVSPSEIHASGSNQANPPSSESAESAANRRIRQSVIMDVAALEQYHRKSIALRDFAGHDGKRKSGVTLDAVGHEPNNRKSSLMTDTGFSDNSRRKSSVPSTVATSQSYDPSLSGLNGFQNRQRRSSPSARSEVPEVNEARAITIMPHHNNSLMVINNEANGTSNGQAFRLTQTEHYTSEGLPLFTVEPQQSGMVQNGPNHRNGIQLVKSNPLPTISSAMYDSSAPQTPEPGPEVVRERRKSKSTSELKQVLPSAIPERRPSLIQRARRYSNDLMEPLRNYSQRRKQAPPSSFPSNVFSGLHSRNATPQNEPDPAHWPKSPETPIGQMPDGIPIVKADEDQAEIPSHEGRNTEQRLAGLLNFRPKLGRTNSTPEQKTWQRVFSHRDRQAEDDSPRSSPVADETRRPSRLNISSWGGKIHMPAFAKRRLSLSRRPASHDALAAYPDPKPASDSSNSISRPQSRPFERYEQNTNGFHQLSANDADGNAFDEPRSSTGGPRTPRRSQEVGSPVRILPHAANLPPTQESPDRPASAADDLDVHSGAAERYTDYAEHDAVAYATRQELLATGTAPISVHWDEDEIEDRSPNFEDARPVVTSDEDSDGKVSALIHFDQSHESTDEPAVLSLQDHGGPAQHNIDIVPASPRKPTRALTPPPYMHQAASSGSTPSPDPHSRAAPPSSFLPPEMFSSPSGAIRRRFSSGSHARRSPALFSFAKRSGGATSASDEAFNAAFDSPTSSDSGRPASSSVIPIRRTVSAHDENEKWARSQQGFLDDMRAKILELRSNRTSGASSGSRQWNETDTGGNAFMIG